MADEQPQEDQFEVENPAGDETANEPKPVDEIDWKAQSRKHEDREKQLAAQVKDLMAKASKADNAESLAESQIAEALEAKQSAENERDDLLAAAQEKADKEAHDVKVSEWKASAMKKFKLPDADILRGDSKEEIAAHAEQLAKWIPAPGFNPLAGKRPANNGVDPGLLAITKQLFRNEE